MKLIALALAGLAVTGCASLPGADPTSNLPAEILDNLQYCKRTYQASIGGLGVPGGSLYIECAPLTQPVPGP